MRKNDKKLAQKRSRVCRIETLEQLTLMSASPNVLNLAQAGVLPLSALSTPVGGTAITGTLGKVSPATSSSPNSKWYSPANIDAAYGITTLANAGYNGAGQTIAIVLAYDIMDEYKLTSTGRSGSALSTNLQSDLHTFDKQYGLPDVTINSTLVHASDAWEDQMTPPLPPLLTSSDPNNTSMVDVWGREAALDVEWAHALAPQANIDVFEAQSNGPADLISTVDMARNAPGVSVVSMSWSSPEAGWLPSAFDSTNYERIGDSVFTTPAGHIPVTFVTGSGDHGGPNADPGSAQYPSSSPNVLSVGGTSLTLSSTGGYGAETGWATTISTTTSSNGYKSTTAWGSGGGLSVNELQPSYMKSFMPSTMRSTPDVAFDADAAKPVNVYHTEESGWTGGAGTSFANQAWAGIIALVNQGRVKNHLSTLAHVDQDIYALSAGDFHDITSGSNGYAPLTGYDLVTGRGAPKADLLVADLIKPEVISGPTYQAPTGPMAAAAGVGSTTPVVPPKTLAAANTTVKLATPIDPLVALSVSAAEPKLNAATAGNMDDFFRTIDSLFGDETETFGLKHKRVGLR